MKRIIALLLGALMLLLSACGTASPAAAPTAAPAPMAETTATPEPTPSPEPTPATAGAAVCVLKAPAILALLEKDAAVTIEEAQEDFYLVSSDAGRGLVEKRLLVPESAGAYEGWTGYAQSGAELREDYHLCGEVLRTFALNEMFTVLADLGDCYYVEIDGTAGFIARDSVSSKFIVVYHGGGGSSGGADGGDITLGYEKKTLPTVVALADTDEPELQPGDRARVLVPGTELIAAWFDLYDEVRVVSEENGICTLYFDGLLAGMERRFLLMDGETAPEPWDGYAKDKAVLFDNFYLMQNDNAMTLRRNTVLHVLADLENCWFVNTEDGQLGYVAKDLVSETYISGYSGGGGSSGGGEWTEPVL